MKKVILMIAFVTGIGAMANAQTKTREHKTPQQRAEVMTKNLETKLSLSKEQSVKVNNILLARAAKLDSLKGTKVKGDRKKNFAAAKSILEGTDQQLNAVLTADQQKAYAELKTAKIAKMKEGFKGRKHKAPEERAAGMTKRLEKKLNLTQDQSAKVKTILLAQATQMQKLKADSVKGDRKQKFEAFKSIRKSTDEQLSTVFNADQKKAYDEMKAAHKGKMKGKRHAGENKEG